MILINAKQAFGTINKNIWKNGVHRISKNLTKNSSITDGKCSNVAFINAQYIKIHFRGSNVCIIYQQYDSDQSII